GRLQQIQAILQRATDEIQNLN
ncbi:MAG: hypothetical protein JWM03_962, partial [Rhodocyclales bacterium]|nr:hypothetical protein [Rhodocyclales bacterium]